MDRLSRLKALADMLEESLGEASVGVRAQLAGQYRATLAEIEEIEGAGAKPDAPRTAVDEVTARRAARGAGAAHTA